MRHRACRVRLVIVELHAMLAKEGVVSSTVVASLRATILMGVALAMNAHSAESADAADAAAQDEIAAVKALIHETAERWNSQDYRTVLELWDTDEETPFYLAEEQDGWFIGWEPLKDYLAPALPSPAVMALREEMRDISVKFIADDLAIAAWYMHFEMQIRGRAPIGEDVRVSAVVRKKPEGWRYIHWAESPITALVYIEKLFQRDVDHEKFTPLLERSRAVKDAWRAGHAEQAARE